MTSGIELKVESKEGITNRIKLGFDHNPKTNKVIMSVNGRKTDLDIKMYVPTKEELKPAVDALAKAIDDQLIKDLLDGKV